MPDEQPIDPLFINGRRFIRCDVDSCPALLPTEQDHDRHMKQVHGYVREPKHPDEEEL